MGRRISKVLGLSYQEAPVIPRRSHNESINYFPVTVNGILEPEVQGLSLFDRDHGCRRNLGGPGVPEVRSSPYSLLGGP